MYLWKKMIVLGEIKSNSTMNRWILGDLFYFFEYSYLMDCRSELEGVNLNLENVVKQNKLKSLDLTERIAKYNLKNIWIFFRKTLIMV